MISTIIQAGGRSSRMGQDKGLVPLAGKPMIEHVLERVRGLGDEIILTTNFPQNYAYLNLPMASDEEPGAGALPGMLTALRAAAYPHVLIVACDMPFLNRPLLEHLLSLAPQADVVVPFWEENYQPMHAVYGRERCLAAVEKALARGRRRLISFYDDLHVLTIPPDTIRQYDPRGLSFFNANTPEELAEAESFYQQTQLNQIKLNPGAKHEP